jgi:two-component system, sensor histidine kinase and response regulator
MGRSHILVVEDHKPMLAAIQTILEGEGYTVFTAGDGVEALQVLEKTKLDLIVADIMMPRMDGYTLYETVRARPEWVLIPFIFLTAKSEQEEVLKGKQLGAEDYITKPFDPEELTVAVRARLMRAQTIQEATNVEFDQLKQQIITMLGHELRTPLTYVSGYTELALEDASSLSPDAMQEFLTGIKRGADRLTQLVEDLLLLIRLDTGRTEEEFDALVTLRQDLATVITRTVKKYEKQATDFNVTLEVNVESDLPPVRLCQPLFVDALGRLMENGIKFSRDIGGRVTIEARSVEKWVEVIVSDEGVGIPSSDLAHLFERFRQIGREKMEQQGSGLGLAIAQELIHLHGGEITTESTLEKGSTFTIRLPRLSTA